MKYSMKIYENRKYQIPFLRAINLRSCYVLYCCISQIIKIDRNKKRAPAQYNRIWEYFYQYFVLLMAVSSTMLSYPCKDVESSHYFIKKYIIQCENIPAKNMVNKIDLVIKQVSKHIGIYMKCYFDDGFNNAIRLYIQVKCKYCIYFLYTLYIIFCSTIPLNPTLNSNIFKDNTTDNS